MGNRDFARLFDEMQKLLLSGHATETLASLRAPIDAFFDGVMVNADDAAVRANRQALLKQLRELFLQVADISVLQ